jgi:hypothetical protein
MAFAFTHQRRVLIVVAVVAVIAAFFFAWYRPIQDQAKAQVDAGLKRALISFASARTLNAIISVVQGTEMSVQPFGVGLTLTPGQVLDPINDLLEQIPERIVSLIGIFLAQTIIIPIILLWAGPATTTRH